MLHCLHLVFGFTASLSLNGWGLTMVDSLDTMIIMDLSDEFYSALPDIAHLTFHLNPVRPPPPFCSNLLLISLHARTNSRRSSKQLSATSAACSPPTPFRVNRYC
jgi:hypothetical protein